MRFFFVSLAVLACAVAGTSAQWGFLDDVKEWFNNARRDITSRLMNSDSFADFNSTLKDLLSRGNLSSLSLDEVRRLPDRFWSTVGAGPISTLQQNARDFVKNNKLSGAPLIREELQIMIDTNVTQERAIEQLRSLLRDESTSGVATASAMKKELLMMKLGDPTQWREENITNMRELLFYLPLTMLTRINDQKTLQKLYEEVRRCMGTIVNGARFGSCPSQTEAKGEGTGTRALYMLSLRTWLLRKLYGEPETWTTSTVDDTGMAMDVVPPLIFPLLSQDVFTSRKADIFRVLQSNEEKRAMVGRRVAQNFLKWNKIQTASSADVNSVLKELTQPRLRQFVYRGDLPKKVLQEDTALMTELDKNAVTALENGRLDAGTLEAIMLGYSNIDRFTTEEARAQGGLLPLAPAETLNRTLQDYKLNPDDYRKMADSIQKSDGPMAYEKLLALKGKLMQLPSSGTTITINNIPDALWDAVSIRYLMDLPLSNRVYALGRNVTFTPAKMNLLVSTIPTGSVRNLPGNAKDAVPLKTIENMSANDARLAAQGTPPMPAYSKIGLLVATKTFDNNRVNIDSNNADVAMYLRAVDARKIEESNIVDTLMKMKDTFPTRGACQVLKGKFVNNSMAELMTRNDDEVFQLLSPTDIENMPLCVIAAFGEGRVRSLSDTSKSILLDRLVRLRWQMLSTDSLTRPMVELIVSEGLRAKGWPEVITADDVQKYGELLLFAPTDVLNSITEEAAPTALRIFNMLASSALMPCLDGGRRSALSNMVAKALGDDPSTWTDLYGACCLLYVLSPGQLSRAPQGALVPCNCPRKDLLQHRAMAVAKQVECRAHIGGDYDGEVWSRDNVRRVQAMAALDLLDPTKAPDRRRKRAVGDVSVCNRASVSGVDDISAGELQQASREQVLRCLAALGSRYMDDGKARILLEKVRDSLSPRVYNSINNSLIMDMNFIMKGIRPEEIRDLPRLTYPEFNDAVAVFGDPRMMFSDEQLRAFAEKVIGVDKWRRVSEMTSTDIGIASRLFCATNETIINTFNNENFQNAVGVLGVTLEGCNREQVLVPMAAKAKGVLSFPPGRAALQVQELGVIIAGMDPDDIRGLPPIALSGLTPTSMRSMTPEAVGRMTADQIRNLQPTTAQVMSGAQQGALSGEQRQALTEALAEGGASGVLLSTLALALTMVNLVFWR